MTLEIRFISGKVEYVLGGRPIDKRFGEQIIAAFEAVGVADRARAKAYERLDKLLGASPGTMGR